MSGGDGGVGTDSGSRVPAPEAPADPAPPAAAALPALTPCPTGWRELADGDYTVCDPWPASGRATCTGASAHFPGEPGCRTLGTAATGEFPEVPAGGIVRYVRAGAPAGGDGSAAAPFSTISSAAGRLGPATIAVARGTYDEHVSLHAGVTLWGAAVDGVVITDSGPRDGARAVVSATGSGVVVRNLTISGNSNGADAVGGGRSLRLEDVLIDAPETVGVYIAGGATFEADNLVVRGVRSVDGRLGRGLSVEMASTATVTHAVFDHCAETGVFVGGAGTDVHLSDSAIVDTAPRGMDRMRGYGLFVIESTATLDRVAIEASHEEAVRVSNPGTTLTATDVVVRDVTGRPTDGLGVGFSVDQSSTASLSRTLVERAGNAGMLLDGDGTTVSLADVVVRDTLAQTMPGPMAGGRGIFAQDGVAVTGERVLIARTEGVGLAIARATVTLSDFWQRDSTVSAVEPTFGHGVGVAMDGSASITRGVIERNVFVGVGGEMGTLHLEDIVVRGTSGGAAVLSQRGLQATVARVLIESMEGIGMSVGFDGASLDAEDVVVRDVAARASDGLFGEGISAATGGSLVLRRALVERATEAGVAIGGTSARIDDLTVRGTRSRASDGLGGHGLQIQAGATVTVTRALIDQNHGNGVYAISDGTVATLRDLRVQGTHGARYMGIDGVFGEGLTVIAGARVTLGRAWLERNSEAGIIVFGAGSRATLTDVRVAHTLVRECVATGGCTPAGGAGSGVIAMGGAALDATGFDVSDNALCGVQLASGASLDLHDGLVARNVIGANVQVEGYDFARLSDRVAYTDNERPLDSAALPVPEPSMALTP